MQMSQVFFFGGGKREKGLKVAGLLGLFYLRRVRGFYRKRRSSHLQSNVWCQESQDIHPEMRREPQKYALRGEEAREVDGPRSRT